MNRPESSFRDQAQAYMLFGCLLLAATLTWSQTQPPLQKSEPDNSTTQSEETTHKISPKEAEELFRSVDDILKFASKETGLPIKHTVKRRLTSRDEVAHFIQKNMVEDKDAERF